MMQFKEQKPIYLQIADLLKEYIIKGEWGNSERIPALREIAVQMEVNPNTVMRTYTYLQEKGIIYNKRGIGYFTASDARQQILSERRKEFMRSGLPEFFETLSVLNLDMDEVRRLHEEYLRQSAAPDKENTTDENE